MPLSELIHTREADTGKVTGRSEAPGFPLGWDAGEAGGRLWWV